MSDILNDSNVWVAISFVIFGFIVYKFAGKFIVGALDKKIEEIRREIDEAENLRVEAQELLAQYQRKQRDAEKEAKSIIKNAEEHAEKIRVKAEADLAEAMARKEEQLTERLKRIEDNAIADIQNHAAELAVNATTQIIEETLSKDVDQALKDKTISSVSQNLN
ncbi:MAG: hypothetical protein AAF569_07895 [Pseudomonadota bacterium]